MGVASIRGYQGKYKSDRSKVAACMKHFIAYGAPWRYIYIYIHIYYKYITLINHLLNSYIFIYLVDKIETLQLLVNVQSMITLYLDSKPPLRQVSLLPWRVITTLTASLW